MPIKVETFSAAGCGRCAETRDALKAVVDEFGAERVQWLELDVLKEIDYAVELGVISPPAMAIDGELVFPTLPPPERLRAELTKRLKAER